MYAPHVEPAPRMPVHRIGAAIALVLGLVLVGGCATTRPEDDPVQVKLNDVDARVTRIERIISNQSLVELAQHIDSLQADVRQLRGRIEELEYKQEAMKKQQKDLYNDLDKRVAALGGGASGAGGGIGSGGGAGAYGGAGPAGGGAGSAGAGAAGSAGLAGGAGALAGGGSSGGAATAGGSTGGDTSGAGAAGGAAHSGGASASNSGAAAGGSSAGPASGSAIPDSGAGVGTSEEQRVYAQSFDALKAGSYSVAITGFKDFLTNYPSSPLAENAQYWLGEAYYVTHDLDAAASAFRSVLQKWPNSRKTPDALLKLGYTQLDQKKTAEGRATLSQVTKNYPGTDAARLANELLQRAPAKN